MHWGLDNRPHLWKLSRTGKDMGVARLDLLPPVVFVHLIHEDEETLRLSVSVAAEAIHRFSQCIPLTLLTSHTNLTSCSLLLLVGVVENPSTQFKELRNKASEHADLSRVVAPRIRGENIRSFALPLTRRFSFSNLAGEYPSFLSGENTPKVTNRTIRQHESCVAEDRVRVEARMVLRYERSGLSDLVKVGDQHIEILRSATQEPTSDNERGFATWRSEGRILPLPRSGYTPKNSDDQWDLAGGDTRFRIGSMPLT